MQLEPTMGAPRPGTLMLHLLGKCNLTCAHCYMEGAPGRRERLPLPAVLDAIEDCTTLGVGSLYVTGGEPMMYRELRKVLEQAATITGMQTTLCTNATLLTERHAAWMAPLGLHLNVSVDGQPDYHDTFRRQRGAFARAARGLRIAAAAGMPVTIIMTVSRDNLADVAAVASFALDIGAKTIRFQPLLRLGRGAGIADKKLDNSDIDSLVMQISDITNQHRGRIECKIVGQSRRFMLAHPCAAYVCNGAGCHRRIAREVKKIVVRENGVILPEATNLDPRFAIGHIADGRLTTLVSRFLDEDYGRFDALCRRTYEAVLPQWTAAVVPWDEILAERSYHDDGVLPAGMAASVACRSETAVHCA